MNGLFGRDFLDVGDLEAAELRAVLGLAHDIKAGRWAQRPLAGRHIAMLFQRPSHRTRVSFEVAIARLGGSRTTLGEQDVQLGYRESVGDAARVLDQYVDGIVARLRSHADIVELASAAEKPVINALTERSHPCQILADLMTLEEVRGPLNRHHVAYVGDGNNIAASLMEASTRLGFALTVITPSGYEPDEAVIGRARGLSVDGDRLSISNDLSKVEGATAVYTDVWTSMGHETERESRKHVFAEYQVNEALMATVPDAVFMHCLPAHRGEEVTDAVIDGKQSVVFQQAGNRLYTQMALMAELFGSGR
ncbi:MAG TPA: ornithine carbamoyltransferase [Candidatus Dormibacteraeota bacterium]|nr:ornithine carbamoyltransferase [Candidatus Dormibacteraeota bacterium]